MSETNHLQSLDPRVARLELPADQEPSASVVDQGNHLPTYEVFHQAKSGGRHTHVGSVHAPNHAMAVLFGKEQFGRRSACVNMWVVKTEDIVTLTPEDAEFFVNNKDKIYREASGYRVMQKLNEYKKTQI